MSKEPGKDLSNPGQFVSMFTTPLSTRGWPRWLVFMLAIIGFIYLLNPTAGVFEFIPDVIPGIGNLDEGVALLLIWIGVLEYFEGSKSQPQAESKETEPESAPKAAQKADEDVIEGSWEEDSPSES